MPDMRAAPKSLKNRRKGIRRMNTEAVECAGIRGAGWAPNTYQSSGRSICSHPECLASKHTRTTQEQHTVGEARVVSYVL